MPKFANVVTIEVAPGHRDQVVTVLAAHKARVTPLHSRRICTGHPSHNC